MSVTYPQVLSCQAPRYSPFGAICEQHADEVTALWELWQTALAQPMYDKKSLSVLENKIRANFAGMMSNADDAWSYCVCTFNGQQAGQAFAMAQIAFRSYKVNRIRHLINLVEGDPILIRGLISALAWFPADIALPWLNKFLKSKNLNHKTLALRVCRLRNEAPTKYLKRFLQHKHYNNHTQLYIQSLRIVGELKIHSAKASLYQALECTYLIKFWGLYSLILLGDHHLAEHLSPYLFRKDELQLKAMEIAFRILPNNKAWDLIYELREYPQFKRQAIQATGILGDPSAIPWILEQMKNPALSKLCGEVFFNITGIDIEISGLALDTPEAVSQISQLTTNWDSTVFDADEQLPWPNTHKVALHWHYNNQNWAEPDQRYFLGIKINIEELKFILQNHQQRQRRSAAVELALLLPEFPLYNTRGLSTHEK